MLSHCLPLFVSFFIGQLVAAAVLRSDDARAASERAHDKRQLLKLPRKHDNESEQTPGSSEKRSALHEHEVFERWSQETQLEEREERVARHKMFKGMLAKWGASLQEELRGTVHQVGFDCILSVLIFFYFFYFFFWFRS